MRAFPRIARRGRARRRRRPTHAAPARRARRVLLLAGPLLLAALGVAAHAAGEAWAAFALLASSAALALVQRAALSRLAPARTLNLSDSDDRRFLLDLSGGVRAAADINQLYAQVADKIGREFGVRSVRLFIRDEATGEFVCRAPPEPEGAPPLALGPGAFVVRRLRHLADPLGVEPEGLGVWTEAAAPESREARAREVEVLRRVDARLLVQARARERLTGVLALGPRAGGRPFSPEDKLLLGTVAGQLALVIENAKLLERMVEEERLRRELLMAAEVQQRLFPERPPRSPALELAGFCQPARKVGGDYYDFLTFESGQVGLVVADVAGKGMSAALLMSTLQASLRAQVAASAPEAADDGALAELAAAINRLLCKSTGPASYVTFFYAQFDQRLCRLSYVNAGHNPPLLVRAHGVDGAAPDRLEAGGPVLGLFEGCRYEQGAVPLRGGDILIGYTDGVIEALNVQGDEYGEERLVEITSAAAPLSAEAICERIVRSVGDWSAGAPQHDDLTLVVLKVSPAPGA